MSPTLPKPATPQTPPAALPPKPVGSPPGTGDKTVFSAGAPANKPLTKPTPPPVAPIQMAGRNIPIPTAKPLAKPAAPAATPPVNQPLPTAAMPSSINPALAPKPAAAPITPLPTTPLKTGQTPSSLPPRLPGGLPTKPPLAASASGTPPAPKMASVKPPLLAQLKENPKKWLLIGLGAILGITLIWLLLSRVFGGGRSTSVQPGNPTTPTRQVTLTYWGLWEPTSVLEQVINEYEAAHPGVNIDYRVQSHRDYRERLQTAIASGQGPDIFRFHASWTPMLAGDLATLPANVMSASEFQSTFYPVAASQLSLDGKLVGLPVMYDGLVLYYNKDVLQTAGAEPPATWAELKQLANQLTVPANENDRRTGGIQRSGLAIGNASNVDHFADILTLLILQNGGDPGEPAFAEVRDALVFYTNFINDDYIWDSTLPSSTVAFARGDAAMMLAPSWRAHDILNLNPSLNFGTAPLPQLSEEKITLANYWAEGVNEKSGNKNDAWEFLKYLTSSDVMQKLYSSQSQVRAFGEPYSRQDLGVNLEQDPYVAAVLSDAPAASGWYMNSATHDNGLNDNVIGYYRAAVEALLAGEEPDEVLLTLEQGVKQELRQYGLAE